MRRSSWTPSIVPRGDDQDVYLVMDDLGRLGRVWREADVEATGFETVVTDLLEGQYKNPIGIFCFNPAEGWSRDVSEDVARELRRRCDLQLRDAPLSIRDFVERHEGPPIYFKVRTMTNERAVRYRRLALAEPDPEKARLLYLIAEEADRGVLATADWKTPRHQENPKPQSAE
jgi:hypothetical protein